MNFSVYGTTVPATANAERSCEFLSVSGASKWLFVGSPAGFGYDVTRKWLPGEE